MLSSHAVATITLPLQGYYRPGRYFPVQIDGDDAGKEINLTAQGCLPTQVKPSAASRRIVPMLATADAMDLDLGGQGHVQPIRLRTPEENERLIASTLADVSPAMSLFPGQRLLPIRLDSAEALPGPPAAWEALDAVLLDADGFARITDNQRSVLLTGGVMLICTGDSPPDVRWPWVHRDGLWILSHKPSGPAGNVVDEDAYAPTYAWSLGWSTTVRGQVMGVGILLTILTLVLLLRPNRWTIASAIVLPMLATLGISAWRASLGTINRAGGDILTAGDGLTQRDAWVYERARESSVQSVNWSGATHPIFSTDRAIAQMRMKLIVTAQGDLQFNYAATAGHTMAFVRREVLPGKPPAASLRVQSPMLDLARTEYPKPGEKVTGQISAPPGRWATVVIGSQAN